MPDLAALIDAARSHYLSNYRQAIVDYCAKFRPGGPEVLVELPRETCDAYRLYRVDLASGAVNPPNFTEVNPETRVSYDPAEFVVDGMVITLSPIVWNGVEFHVTPAIADDHQLQEWALYWIDPEEQREPDESGLGGYLHSITEPETSDTLTAFSVDFGSTGLECFNELLRILRAMNAGHISIHSKALLGE